MFESVNQVLSYETIWVNIIKKKSQISKREQLRENTITMVILMVSSCELHRRLKKIKEKKLYFGIQCLANWENEDPQTLSIIYK